MLTRECWVPVGHVLEELEMHLGWPRGFICVWEYIIVAYIWVLGLAQLGLGRSSKDFPAVLKEVIPW